MKQTDRNRKLKAIVNLFSYGKKRRNMQTMQICK